MLKKSLWALLTLLVVLAAVVAINTARKGSRQLQVAPLAPVAVDATAVAARLAEAVRLQTLSSRDDAQLSADQFKALHALLQARFPRVHAALQREVVGDLSLLYTWKGADPQARPIMLMAHQDVVPESNMPAYPWLERTAADAGSVQTHMRGLRTLGAPYSDDEIAKAPEEIKGKTELDAVIAYLQVMGIHRK